MPFFAAPGPEVINLTRMSADARHLFLITLLFYGLTYVIAAAVISVLSIMKLGVASDRRESPVLMQQIIREVAFAVSSMVIFAVVKNACFER